VAAFYSAVVAARKGGGLARTWPRGRRGGGPVGGVAWAWGTWRPIPAQ
jgi:hypothetical protein